MTPSLFNGQLSRDEYGWCQDPQNTIEIASTHRSTFITYSDLAWLKEKGIDALRLPIPYWTFGDFPPFYSCQTEVEWLLEKADELGLKVLLDLHTAPGSQNGNDHSGRAGPINWVKQDNIEETLNVLSKLAGKYANHPAVFGIELLNEPDRGIRHATLLDFYKRGIDAVHAVNPNIIVVVSDAYRPGDWVGSELGAYDNVWLDVHMYQVFSEADRRLDIHKHIKKVKAEWNDLLAKLQQTMPVMIGEWSAALDNRTFKGMDDFARDKAVQAYMAAQIEVFDTSAAWFYWSYKTESPDAWNFRSCVDRGWLSQVVMPPN